MLKVQKLRVEKNMNVLQKKKDQNPSALCIWLVTVKYSKTHRVGPVPTHLFP